MGYTKPETKRAYYERNKIKWQTVYRDNERAKPDFVERSRATDKRNKRKRRAQILSEYGGRCVCCGETEPRFLELDHIDGIPEEERNLKFRYRGATSFGSRFYLKVIKEGFPKDKYRLLCSNCNRGRWRNGGTCPHEAQPEYGLSMC